RRERALRRALLARHRSARPLSLRQKAERERPAVSGGRRSRAARPRSVLEDGGRDGRGQSRHRAGARRARRAAAGDLSAGRGRQGASARRPRSVRHALPQGGRPGRPHVIRGRGRGLHQQEADDGGRPPHDRADHRVRPQTPRMRRRPLGVLLLASLLLCLGFAGAGAAQAKPDGEMRWALYITISPNWFDPGKLLHDKVKEITVVSPTRVRFTLHEPWPDFMSYYGGLVSGAGWIVPKKYFEQVGPDGFKKAPVGLGPYRFVSHTPGVELVMEAFEGYWRKMPSVKRVVFKMVPESTTRVAMLKRGEVDIAYLLEAPQAIEA